MIYFIAFVLIYLCSVLLKLKLWVCVALGVFACFMIPKFRKRYAKMLHYRRRFYDVSLYLDTILSAFVKEEKVELAVRDVYQSLPDGKMKSLVGTAHEYMTMTYDEVEVLRESLALIEQEYPCKRMQDVHRFMTHVEYYGGEIEKPVNLLISDKSRWEKRIREEIANRRKQFTDVLLSVAASLVICGVMSYLPLNGMDISGTFLLQLFTFGVIAADVLIVFAALKILTEDWIAMQMQTKEEYYMDKMKEYQNYDEKKQKTLSYLLGAAGAVLTVIAFGMGKRWITAGLLLVTLLFMNQHRVGHHLLEKKLEKELKLAFPNWLLDLVLLLQSENVQVALEKSKEFVPGVLRAELNHLTEELELEPESARPYHDFLREFAIPEIHSAMGILYSISIGSSGNADK